MKIAIIGAGISGLTLAAAIRQKLPEAAIEIYERDSAPFSRPQGYAIGLSKQEHNPNTGLYIFSKLGLEDKILGGESVQVKNFVINTQSGRELFSSKKLITNSIVYRVQRSHIKKILLEAIGDIPIYFNSQATGYKFHTQGVTILFAGGNHVDADYAIACDGASSSIRKQMIGDEKSYLGLTSIYGLSKESIDHSLLEGGYFMTIGNDGSSFFCYRQPDGVYFSYTVCVSNEEIIANKNKKQLLEFVQTKTKAWGNLIRKIVQTTSLDTIGIRGYYDKNPVNKIHEGTVWLIGDAAHPMCPFRGQGANMAIVDAYKLAECLATLPQDRTDAKSAWDKLENEMVERGKNAVLASRNSAKKFHTKNKIKQFIRNLGFWIMTYKMKRRDNV